MKTILKTIARVAVILLASLIVVGATMLLTPANSTVGNAGFGEQNRFAQVQTTDQQSTSVAQSGTTADAQSATQGQPVFAQSGFGDREEHEGAAGAFGWQEVGANLLKVGVIVLPFAVIGALKRRRKLNVAGA
jgi:uncharacterized protein YxeA